MKASIYLTAFFAWMALSVSADSLTVPEGAETRENVHNAGFPLSLPGDIISQQVFAFTLFPILSQPGQVFQIDGLAFRLSSAGPDPDSASATLERVEILVSSGNGPFTLDLTANHGANKIIVYDGPLTLSGNVPGGTTPSLFELQIDFENPFFYDRSPGSLVVEIRKYGSSGLGRAIGAAQVPGTRFYYQSGGRTDSSGDAGPETFFHFQVVPEPSVNVLLALGVVTLALIKFKRK